MSDIFAEDAPQAAAPVSVGVRLRRAGQVYYYPAEGLAAMRAYTRLMNDTLSATERAQIVEDLKAYCGQDTLAMVRIVEEQKRVAGMAQEARA